MRPGVILMAVLFGVAATRAGDLDSGPARGEKLQPLKVHVLNGEQKDKDVDFAATRTETPTVYVFVQADKWDRPMFRFVKALDEAVQKDFPTAAVVAVWLTDKQDATREYLPKLDRYFTGTTLTCFPDEKTGPKDWGINADAHATVVVVAMGRVAERFGYRSVNETDARAVLVVLKKVAAKK